jgi:hypothetical protein
VELPEDSGMEYSLFFTVKPDNSDPSIIWYQRPQSEMDAEALYLVDLLDVDGDGSNELIARRVFYENYRYEVYKRLHSRWEQIFKTEVLGCL